MRTAFRFFVAVLGTVLLARGDTFFQPESAFAVEVSLENSPYLRLPMYRNAITSLEVVGDMVIGGTSANAGLVPYVFVASLSKRRLEMVFPLEKCIGGQRAIRSGFARGAGGLLYAGTLPDKAGASGHVIRVLVRNQGLEVSDLGTPIPGEGILALAADPSGRVIYGLSHPAGRFFVMDVTTKHTEVYDDAAPNREAIRTLYDYGLGPEEYLCRRLAVDRSGRVYGSRPVNKIFRFDPARKKFEVLPDELPAVWGRRDIGRVDAWAVAPDGALYGGCAGDGQLFRIDPASGRVMNLGKPTMMPRVTGLAFGRDGSLFGISGAAPGYAHLFVYEPKTGFVDLGNPRFTMRAPGIEQGIAWRAFQIATVAASEDGQYIVLGEDEALSQLMVFPIDSIRR
jgi:hypothetical protein